VAPSEGLALVDAGVPVASSVGVGSAVVLSGRSADRVGRGVSVGCGVSVGRGVSVGCGVSVGRGVSVG
jgi:hypothetical protein